MQIRIIISLQHLLFLVIKITTFNAITILYIIHALIVLEVLTHGCCAILVVEVWVF